DAELVPVEIARAKGKALVTRDEHPRPETTLEQLAGLPTPFRANGTVTAGNASGVNDGAAALLIASEEAARRLDLTPRARILAAATAGVEPRIMGMGPLPATRKVLSLARLTLDELQVIELNEAFASQALAVLRDLKLPDDASHVNPNGGAIALGHPLGMSGIRHRPGGLDDDLHDFPQLAHRAHDRLVGYRRDVIDQAVDLRERPLAERAAQAVGDGHGLEARQDAAGPERARGIVGAGGLDADHADGGLERLGRDRGAAQQSPAAHRAEDEVEIGDLRQQFHRG